MFYLIYFLATESHPSLWLWILSFLEPATSPSLQDSNVMELTMWQACSWTVLFELLVTTPPISLHFSFSPPTLCPRKLLCPSILFWFLSMSLIGGKLKGERNEVRMSAIMFLQSGCLPDICSHIKRTQPTPLASSPSFHFRNILLRARWIPACWNPPPDCLPPHSYFAKASTARGLITYSAVSVSIRNPSALPHLTFPPTLAPVTPQFSLYSKKTI